MHPPQQSQAQAKAAAIRAAAAAAAATPRYFLLPESPCTPPTPGATTALLNNKGMGNMNLPLNVPLLLLLQVLNLLPFVLGLGPQFCRGGEDPPAELG